MRRLIILIIIMFFLSTNTISAESEQTFGPDKWEQYRMNSHNNPVYNNDDFNDQINTVIKTDEEIRATPVIINDTVYIGNHNNGEITAYDLDTDEIKWQNKAPNWIHSEIISVDNQLFVGYGNRYMKSDTIRGTGKNGLLSLDPETGKVLWNFDTEGQVMPTPAFYDETVYITTGDRHLYGVNPETGEEEMSLGLDAVVSMSAPSVENGILYVGGALPSTFQAIDLKNQKVLWKNELPEIDKGIDDVPPVVSDDLVITTGVTKTDTQVPLRKIYDESGLLKTYKAGIKKVIGSVINRPPKKYFNHNVYAMDINSGDIVWKKSLGKGEMVPNNKSGAPMIYDRKVYVGSPLTETFYSLDAKNGEILWEQDSIVNKAPPVADDNIVYFVDAKGFVHAFDSESGEFKGRKHLGGALAPSGPVLMNDHLVVGSQDSNAYILPTEEILGSNDLIDTNEKTKSSFSFVMFVYIIPILILIGIVGAIIFGVKKLRRRKS